MKNVVIVSAVRTPMGRALKGTLAFTRPDDLAALALRAAVDRAGLDPALVEDVILGCAMPEGQQGLNLARQAALLAGFPVSVAGVTVNRFCSSGLQAVAMAAQAIMTGMADVVVAGGVESMSAVPMTGHRFSANPRLLASHPGAYLGMGHTAENLARQHRISRQEQDQFALESHQKAAAAWQAGAFAEELAPVHVRTDTRAGAQVESTTTLFERDELVRPGTTLEALASLKPSFHLKGTVTPGNSSPLTDGASALLMMSEERAAALALPVLGRFLTFAVAGVAPEIMGIGPVAAIPKALARASLTMAQVDHLELNEAFAAQALAVIREAALPADRTNPLGGALALGHPLGCTGARLTTTLLHALRRRGGGIGVVSMCVGGGQGAAGLFQVG